MENRTITFEQVPAAISEVLERLLSIEGRVGQIALTQATQLSEKLLSGAEACKLFNPTISVKTLTKWAKDGLIPEHRIGGRIYYRYTEVIESAKALKKFKATRS